MFFFVVYIFLLLYVNSLFMFPYTLLIDLRLSMTRFVPYDIYITSNYLSRKLASFILFTSMTRFTAYLSRALSSLRFYIFTCLFNLFIYLCFQYLYSRTYESCGCNFDLEQLCEYVITCLCKVFGEHVYVHFPKLLGATFEFYLSSVCFVIIRSN
jgi:hypothetical protein